MQSKLKKYIIFLLESPLITVFTALRLLVCVLTVLHIRILRRGIDQGKRLHTVIEHHELGNIKRK